MFGLARARSRFDGRRNGDGFYSIIVLQSPNLTGTSQTGSYFIGIGICDRIYFHRQARQFYVHLSKYAFIKFVLYLFNNAIRDVATAQSPTQITKKLKGVKD